MRPQALWVKCDGEGRRAIANTLERRYDWRHVTSPEDTALALPAVAWAAVVAEYVLNRSGSGLEVLQLARGAPARSGDSIARPLPSLMRDVERLAQPHLDRNDGAPGFLDSPRLALDDLHPHDTQAAHRALGRGDGGGERDWAGAGDERSANGGARTMR